MKPKAKEHHEIKLSSQVFHEYERLKNMILSLTGHDEVSDDQMVMALVSSFVESIQPHTHAHDHNHGGCCGQEHCDNHTHDKKEKGECCGGGCC